MSQTNPVDYVGDAFSGRDPAKSAMLIYILYVAGLAVAVTPLIGIVLAYMYRGQMTGWLESHAIFIIRTFWIAILYFVLASILTLFLIGFLLYLLIAIWLIIRCVKGMQALSRDEPIADPRAWVF